MLRSKPNRRSDCPISFSLDLIGDSWSLLIIRDMVFAGKELSGSFSPPMKGSPATSCPIACPALKPWA